MGRGLKRKKWSLEEDAKLMRYIKEHEAAGSCNWASLPEQAGLLRSAKSCNSRYNNYLKVRDDLKGGDFTREEEETIVKLHQIFGNSWATIAKYLPGRNKTQIKNYWKHSAMDRVPWIIENLGTSEMVMSPNLENNKEKPQKNESCASTSRNAVGEEVALSSTNLEWFDLAEVDMINNNLSENSNLSSGNGTGGEELAWSPIDFELDGYAGMGISNSILADDRNLNYGRDGEGSIEFLNSSSIAGEGFAYHAGSNWFGFEDATMVNSSLIEEGYFRGSMEVADPVRSDMPQGDITYDMPAEIVQRTDDMPAEILQETEDMPSEMVQETDRMPAEIVQSTDDEIFNNLMAALQDDSAGAHDAPSLPDGLDLVYAMFADCL